ncbi:hypothetical protein [Falsiroseomonas tokyonensis]|uniref:Uncharacterized protein n=1 Tax=Falsiroseomonas tokyonensis TaxID=430521 RepID=A0ABV7BU57_9PROT|nr:hypothetical protein [Falsiroseomonas tokyonensis]MBU8539205.1 hypothetical protein [Falsiroseomonas tokyonensis]
MQIARIASFAAGFLAGGIVLGGYVAHARITSVNLSIGGVLPNSEGGLLCVTAANAVRPSIRGTWREGTVGVPGGTATGIWMRCPA